MPERRHTPLRRCRVCRQQAPKMELIRWVMTDGQFQPDPRQTMPGRGNYSCNNERCREILPRTIKKK